MIKTSANRFTNPLQLRAVRRVYRGIWKYLPPGLRTPIWEISAPFYYYTDHHRITVPIGFRFDGTSVPLVLRAFFPRAHPDYMQAAALHDYLYTHCGNTNPNVPWMESTEYQFLSRRQVDLIFYNGLKILGMSRLWAWPMYAAVRLGGTYRWNKSKIE